jgi:hypothetical protein
MGDETNKIKWIGIRSTNPESNIPIKINSTDKVLPTQPGPWAASYQGVTRTQVIATATVTNGYTVFHTVTAGKTLYITSAHLSGYHSTLTKAFVNINDTGDNWYKTILRLNIYSATSNAVGLCFPMPLVVPAGYKIVIGSSLGVSDGGITGWEE